MEGDARVRLCSGCGEHVYSIADHTDTELRELGSFCGYFSGETKGPPQSRRAVMVGTLLTTIAPLLAQDFRIRVQVRDAAQQATPGAAVEIGGRRATTDEAGTAILTGLPAGRYEVMVQKAGFRIWRGTYSTGLSNEMIVPVELQVGSVGGSDFVELHGELFVAVSDPRDKPIGNAEITADCGGAGKVHGLTDEKGNAVLPLLHESDCKVAVVAAGFQPWETVQHVPSGGTVRLRAKLSLPTHQERVDVHPSAGRRFWNWMTSCTRR